MRTARTTIAASILAMGLSLGLVSAGAPAAQAVPDLSTCRFVDGSGTFSDSELVLGVENAATVDISIRAIDCQDESPSFELTDSDGSAWGWGYLVPSGDDPTLLEGTVEVRPGGLSNSVAGVPLSGMMYIGAKSFSFGDATLTLKREVWMLEQVAPSKVKKSKSFLVYGLLDVAHWDLGLDVGLSKAKVRLQSRIAGGSYKTVKTVTSRTGQQGGSVEAKVKIKKATCFRWVYGGSSTKAALTSGSNCVKIKK